MDGYQKYLKALTKVKEGDISELKKNEKNLKKLLEVTLNNIDSSFTESLLKDIEFTQLSAYISKMTKDSFSQVEKIDELFSEVSKEIERQIGNEMEQDSEEEEEEEEEQSMAQEENIENDDFETKVKKKALKQDNFFSYAEMNKFADEFEDDNYKSKKAPQLKLSARQRKGESEEEEEQENSLYSEEQEMEAEINSKESINYDQFFDAPNNKEAKEEESDENYEDEIFSQIHQIEKSMLSKKNWTMRGEVPAKERPKDSLLTEVLDFEVGLKAPPIPTKELTKHIEDIIKLRIREDLFDDPLPKTKFNLNPKKAEAEELNFGKADKNLAEIYEEKYLGDEKTDKKQEEIQNEVEELCNKFFSMINKMTNHSGNTNNVLGAYNENGEMTVKNIPAIQLEEVGNYVGDNTNMTKSGKELYNKKKTSKSKEEMTSEELQRLHNKRKRNIRTHIHKKEMTRKMQRLTDQTGSKFEARFMMKKEREKKNKNNTENKEGKFAGNDYKSTKFFGKISEMAKK